jgi:methyltransferase (TIGR00027 family)
MQALISAATFRAIQLGLAPVGFAGYLEFVVVSMVRMRNGTSATVLASLYSRYMLHKLGVRRDPACERLMRVMPTVPQLGLSLVTTPTRLAHRVTGYVPRIYRYRYEGEPPFAHQPSARTTFYDEALARHLPEMEQFVVLGAGFDTRCYQLPEGANVRCFEVDAPNTQAYKREMLQRAGVDGSGVAYVPVDFAHEDWLEKLEQAGFRRDRPSLFIWESVSMYLPREAVERTLRSVAQTAAGSRIAFDYVSSQLIESRSPLMRYARAMLAISGEPWKFGLDNTPPVRARVAEFVANVGLALEEQRNFGAERGGKRAQAGFAVASVQPLPARAA